jgi:hypothetical protein
VAGYIPRTKRRAAASIVLVLLMAGCPATPPVSQLGTVTPLRITALVAPASARVD